MDRGTAGVSDAQVGTIELLWGLREPSSRGPKPALSIDRITQAAIDIADAEGLAAVSMQRVASTLAFTKMSLYRYVSGKSELLAAMTEAAIDVPPDLSGVTGGWRAKLETWARLIHATWQRHPWLPRVSEWQAHPAQAETAPALGERVMGPNEVGWVECAVSVLDGMGLDGAEQLYAVFLISGHIRNTLTMTPTGVLPWTLDKQPTPLLEGMRDKYGDSYPALTAAAGSADPDAFTFGLHRILDGLDVLIKSRRKRAKRAR